MFIEADLTYSKEKPEVNNSLSHVTALSRTGLVLETFQGTCAAKMEAPLRL